MFYICGVYNKALCRYFRSIYLTTHQRDLNVRGDILSCMFEDSGNVLLGVFDSTDSSVEWYSVFDLLSIIDSANVEIKGVNIEYLKSHTKRGTARPSNIDSMKSCLINVALANASDEYRQDIAKKRLLGVEILEDGTLMSYHPSFCKDGVLTLPDEVRYLGRNCFSYGDKYPASVFLVGKNFALNHIHRAVQCLGHSDKNSHVVVFQDDITVTINLLTDIQCNFYSRGTISYGNFKKLMVTLANNKRVHNMWRYRFLMQEKRKFFLADSKKICIVDFGNLSVTVVENDGQIKY